MAHGPLFLKVEWDIFNIYSDEMILKSDYNKFNEFKIFEIYNIRPKNMCIKLD